MSPRRGEPARAAIAEPSTQQLYCRFRSECLAVAAMRNWRGMTCASCGDYEALTTLEHRADMEAMADLLAAVASRVIGRRLVRAQRDAEERP